MAFMKKLENTNNIEVNKEEAREKFISGGGLVQADIIQEKKQISQNSKEEWSKVLLRIRTNVLEEIDQLVLDRMGMNRTAWILEAVQEKLKKQSNDL